MRAIITFFAISLFCATNALAGRFVPAFISGNWTGEAYYRDDGAFGFCSIRTGYQSGIYVTFGLLPNGVWRVAFDRPGGFSSLTQRRLDLYIDGQFVFGAPAETFEGGLMLTLPSNVALFQAMRIGYRLKVVTPAGHADFDLSGSAVALSQLLACAQQHSAPSLAEAPILPPAARSGTAASNDPIKFSRDQVLTYAANILSAANITGYRFLPYEETKDLGDVVWTLGDGSIGSILMVKGYGEVVDLNQLTAAISQGDGEDCKGDFVSGKKAPRYIGAVEVRKFFTLCRAGDKSTHMNYSFLKLPKGIYVRYLSGRFGDVAATEQDDGNLIQRSEDAFLQVSLPE